MEPIVIIQEAGPSTTIQISKEEGDQIKRALEENIDSRLTSYCHQIGMEHSNLCNYLGGRKKVSLKALNRIFSNASLEVEFEVKCVIRKQTTSDVEDAPSMNLDDILFSEGPESAQEEQ